jgi:hypothetical protein
MGLRPVAGAYHKDEKQLAELHARISQETFDEAVQENVETFDMSPEEALADAISQFETQGINLSNIVKRVPGAEASDDPAAVIALRDIKATLEAAQEAEEAEEETLEINYGGGIMKMMFMKLSADDAVKVAEQAAALRTACQKNKEELALVTLNGAADSLVSAALAVLQVPSALAPILEALAVVLLDPEGRETLGQRGVAALSAILRRHPEDAGVVRSGFQAVRASMLVHENHRQQFVAAAKLLKLIVPALKFFAEDPPTFLAACGALRASTLSDDLRSKTSKGLEHAKAAVELRVLPLLLDATKGCVGKHSTAALAELMATLSRLTVTDQICSQLADMNALPLAIQELSNNMVDASVAKQACFFLASISGNDNCKVSIVEGNGHVAIIQAMLLHPNNAGMQTDAVSALGNMCLRVPANCEAIAAADGIPAICQAFTQHVTYPRMQSKGPLCIRNMVGRNPEHIPAFLEGYVEPALRQVMGQHEDGYVHNLAKAALREMHLKVDLKEQFQGTLENAHVLDNGDVDGENHWDKFLETPVAQEAIRREMEDAGVSPDAYLDSLT